MWFEQKCKHFLININKNIFKKKRGENVEIKKVFKMHYAKMSEWKGTRGKSLSERKINLF